MDTVWQELSNGFPDYQQVIRVVIRLIAAVILGAVIGYERERAGKAAGLRTHMLVTLGTCTVVLASAGHEMTTEGMSRVIQGIVTGIGFLGAGTILKLNNERDIQGLTTAAGIWMTCTIGIAVGLGELGLALMASVITVIVLAAIGRVEEAVDDDNKREP